MTSGMPDEEVYKLARKRVEEKKGFFTHLIVYLCVNALLVVIWALTGAGFPWFLFPLGGWGIGLLFHFLGTFAFSSGKMSEWENREVEKEVKRIKNQ